MKLAHEIRLSSSWGSLVQLLAGGALLLASACGGSDSGSCGAAQTCGGDVVGTWKIASSCFRYDSMPLPEQCPSATFDVSNLKMMGSITYNADKTYSSSATTSGTMTLHWPSSCLSANGVTITCDLLDTLFVSQDTSGEFSSVSCKGASDGCQCTFTLEDAVSQETGTYSTSGATLSEMASGETSPSLSTYCVKDGKLTQHADGKMAGQEGVSGTLVLTKQ